MKLTYKKIKNFFLLVKKYNLSVASLIANYKTIEKYWKRLTKRRFILKIILQKAKNRIILKQGLSKLGLDTNQNRRRKNKKRSWRVQFSRYIKKHLIKKDSSVKDPVVVENIRDKLKQQLQLFQLGKRKEELLKSVIANKSNSTLLSSCSIIDKKCENSNKAKTMAIDSKPLQPLKPVVVLERPRNCSIVPLKVHDSYSSTEIKPSESNSVANVKKGEGKSFIDSLLTKLQSRICFASSKSNNISSDVEPVNKTKTILSRKDWYHGDDDSVLSTSSDSEFRGFSDSDATAKNKFTRDDIPGLLPTPIVKNSSDSRSAFVSERLEKFIQEIQLSKTFSSNQISSNSSTPDDGLLDTYSKPPKLSCPQPVFLQKPRTVAEKRNILEKKSIKCQILDNENRIYHMVRKRTKANGFVHNNQIKRILEQHIPMTKDVWKAAAWLNTERGKYLYQCIEIDGTVYKLMGCLGNYSSKFKQSASIKPYSHNWKPKTTPICCDKTKPIVYVKVNLPVEKKFDSKAKENSNKKRTLSEKSPVEHKKRLNTSIIEKLKPGPLQSKLGKQEVIDDHSLGPLELFELPSVQLEVWPRINTPLDDFVKPYLKMIVPSDEITKEWASFALSTLVDTQPGQSYSFKIPYCNNQNKILVRRVINNIPKRKFSCNEKLEEEIDAKLEFSQNIDQSDELATTVADVLTRMIDSVGIGLSENSFIMDDPDIDYTKKDDLKKHESTDKDGCSTFNKTKKNNNKVRAELKRLNATIIDAEQINFRKKCIESHCKFGCICESVSNISSINKHCQKLECMFGCTCSDKESVSDEESGTLSNEVKRFREKAISKLAKLEKEFSSTIVLTNNNTFLISNSEESKRHRNAPKRYGDFCNINNLDSSFQIVSPNKTNNESVPDSSNSLTVKKALPPEIEKMRHVTVVLPRMEQLNDLEPLCMVHRLYRCFCDGEAIEGKPFIVTRVDVKMNEEKSEPFIEVVAVRKRQYSFAKDEHQSPLEPIIKKCLLDNNEHNEKAQLSRLRRVNVKKYLLRNKTKVSSVLEHIARNENNKFIKSLLQTRIRESMPSPANDANKNQENASSTESHDHIEPMTNQQQPHNNDQTKNSNLPVISSVFSLPRAHCFDNESPSTKASTGAQNTIINKHGPLEKQVLKELNKIISISMQTISNAQRNSSMIFDEPKPNIMNSVMWIHLYTAFQFNKIFVWEVRMNNKTIVILRTRSDPPEMGSDVLLANAKTIPVNTATYLVKLLRLNNVPDTTRKMSVLLFGYDTYWRILGFTNTTINYLEEGIKVSPNRVSHPNVAKNIDYIFKKLLANKYNEILKVKSNVLVEKVNLSQCESIFLPIPKLGDHRWFMLKIENDFSDVSHNSWGGLLPYDKIRNAIDVAQKTKRTVQVTSPDKNLNPNVYATPDEQNKIFIGPYSKNEDHNILLYQRIDGKLLLREQYEKILGIKRDKVTTGCWLYMRVAKKNAENISEITDDNSQSVENNRAVKLTTNCNNQSDINVSNAENTANGDDDDCILIEDDSIPPAERIQTTLNSNTSKDLPTRQSTETVEKDKNAIITLPMRSKDLVIFPIPPDGDTSMNFVRITESSKQIPQLTVTVLPTISTADEEKKSQENLRKSDGKLDPKSSDDLIWLSETEESSSKQTRTLSTTKPKRFVKISKERLNGDETNLSTKIINLECESAIVNNSSSTASTEQMAETHDKIASSFCEKGGENSTNLNNKRKGVSPSKEGQLINIDVTTRKEMLNNLNDVQKIESSSTSTVNDKEPEKDEKKMETRKTKIKEAKSKNEIIKRPASHLGNKILYNETSKKLKTVFENSSKSILIGQTLLRRKVATVSPITKLFANEDNNSQEEYNIISNHEKNSETSVVSALKSKDSLQELPKVRPNKNQQPSNRSILNRSQLTPKLLIPSATSTDSSGAINNCLTRRFSIAGKEMVGPISGSSRISSNNATNNDNVSKANDKPKTLLTVPKSLLQNRHLKTTDTESTKQSLVQFPPLVSSQQMGQHKTEQSSKIILILKTSELKAAPQQLFKTISTQLHTQQNLPPLIKLSSNKTTVQSSTENLEMDTIELSDDDDGDDVRNRVKDTDTVTNRQTGLESKKKPSNISNNAENNKKNINYGHIASNIPSLGKLPAYKLQNDLYLSLPYRKTPLKLPIQCVNRYMNRYLRNVIPTFVPKELQINWKFYSTKIKPSDREFSLQNFDSTETSVLTKYGPVNLKETITNSDLLKDSPLYIQIMVLQLAYATEGEIRNKTGLQIMNKAIQVISDEKHLEGQNINELNKLKAENLLMKSKYEKLTARYGSPSTNDLKSAPISPPSLLATIPSKQSRKESLKNITDVITIDD